MPNQDEDEIIAKGLLSVKEGIVSGDWNKVCEGYNSISGEDLKPFEKPKSRLESIREMMKVENPPAEKPKKGGRKKKEPQAEPTDEDEDDGQGVQVKKFKGGKRFAKEGFEVIEAEINEEERERNLKAASKKKTVLPHKRAEKPKDTSDADPDSDTYRYYDKPKLRPSWR